MTDDRVRFDCHIEKSEPDQRRFFGRAYIHERDGEQVTDSSGDVVDDHASQQALEEAFYGFVKEYRTGDAGHEVFDAATMIEGFIVTKEKKAAGLFPDDMPEGIYVGFEADATEAGDVLWDGVRSRRFTSLSIVGRGRRVDA